MNFQTVQTQLNDLPPTFKRAGVPYTQWVDSLTSGLVRGTAASDNLLAMIAAFQQARFGWLDIWGLLFNVPRYGSAADSVYQAQIPYVVTAGGGPPVAIANWIQTVWLTTVTIQETFGQLGYSIAFPSTVTIAQITQILASIARVRPAGVPFTVNQTVDGLYLQTINFLAAASVTGAYLVESASSANVTISATTNNSASVLPVLFLDDPTINPSLAA